MKQGPDFHRISKTIQQHHHQQQQMSQNNKHWQMRVLRIPLLLLWIIWLLISQLWELIQIKPHLKMMLFLKKNKIIFSVYYLKFYVPNLEINISELQLVFQIYFFKKSTTIFKQTKQNKHGWSWHSVQIDGCHITFFVLCKPRTCRSSDNSIELGRRKCFL